MKRKTKIKKKRPASKQPVKEAPKERERGEDQSFAVHDRRFWARLDDEDRDTTTTRLPSHVEKLEKKLQQKENEISQLGSAIRALREEQKQMRQRLERQLDSDLLNLKVELFAPLLEVVDNLERSLKSLQEQNTRTDAPEIVEGIAMVHQQFLKTLADAGVEVLDVIDKPFDPQKCEAVAVEERADPSIDNIVVKELSRGYEISGRLIRAARVQVGRYRKEEENRADTAGCDQH